MYDLVESMDLSKTYVSNIRDECKRVRDMLLYQLPLIKHLDFAIVTSVFTYNF